MIKTKQPILINPATKEEAIVYFDTFGFNYNELEQTVTFNLVAAKLVTTTTKKIQEGRLQDFELEEFHQIPFFGSRQAVYKMSTFNKIMSGVEFQDFSKVKDKLMIEQIDYNSSNFWGLTSNDLETFEVTTTTE
jgi:hypothetical protein